MSGNEDTLYSTAVRSTAAEGANVDRFKKTLRAKLNEAAQATPERKRVMLYLDPDVYEALKAFAGKHGLSMNVAAISADQISSSVLPILSAGSMPSMVL